MDGAMNAAASRLGFAAGTGGADGVAAPGPGAGAGAGAGRRWPRPRHGRMYQILSFLPRVLSRVYPNLCTPPSLRPSLMYTQVYDDPSRDTRRHTVSNGSIECFLLSLVLC